MPNGRLSRWPARRVTASSCGRDLLNKLAQCVIASWDRWIRHRPALDESLRLDVGSMTPFLSDFLPRSEATKQSRIECVALDCFAALAMTADSEKINYGFGQPRHSRRSRHRAH